MSQAPFSLFSDEETEAQSATQFVQVPRAGKLESSDRGYFLGFSADEGRSGVGPSVQLAGSLGPLPAQRANAEVGMAARWAWGVRAEAPRGCKSCQAWPPPCSLYGGREGAEQRGK